MTATAQMPKVAKSTNSRKYQDIRSREYLSETEVESLRSAIRTTGRYPHRDRTLILIMFRHGLRVSETIGLRWDQIDFQNGLLHVTRIKNGIPSTHPLRGTEIRALRKLKRESHMSPYVFITERKSTLTKRTIHHIIQRAGLLAEIGFPIHPHMLRHSTGYYLANRGIDTRAIQCYLGHANINNTCHYTALAPNRFNKFWND